MGFNNDLKFGEFYQQELVKVMGMENYEMAKGNFKDYDIKEIITDNNKVRYWEVKADRRTYDTNNLCIEFECNKKPSGITTSTANYYAYFVIHPGNKIYDLYIIPTKRIRREIEKETYKRILNGGDGWKSKFYLFDINVFNKYLSIKN